MLTFQINEYQLFLFIFNFIYIIIIFNPNKIIKIKTL